VSLLLRLALLPRLGSLRLPGKEEAEHFPEDELFHQQCDRQRENHPCDHRDGCDYELHNLDPHLKFFPTHLLLPAFGLAPGDLRRRAGAGHRVPEYL